VSVQARTAPAGARRRSAASSLAPKPQRLPRGAAPVEIELKLRVRARDVEALRARLDRHAAVQEGAADAVYYDTADRRLAARLAALRVRKRVEGGRARWVQTLKTGDGGDALSQRPEWETPAPGGRLALERFAGTPLPELLAGTPLQAVFRTRFQRSVWRFEYGGARIEAALDAGEILASTRREPILELELEIESGPPEAALRLALDLAAGAGSDAHDGLALLPLGESKAARGYRLADSLVPAPVRASARRFARGLKPRTRVDDAARQVVASGSGIVLTHAHELLATGGDAADSEFVHQARVALRRMRSALRLLRRHVRIGGELLDELRWLSACFGAARDWDVLAGQTLPAMIAAADPATAAAWRRVGAAAERRRTQARERLRSVLDEPRFAALMLRMMLWASRRARGRGLRLDRFAPGAARAGYRRLLRAGRFFAALSPPQRHRVRILGKRLRYGVELLRPALPPPAVDACLASLERLQEAVGAANDAALAQSMIARLTRSAPIREQVRVWAERAAASSLLEAEQCLAELERLDLRF
jgi:inorganic triphosphatase YgiF